MVKEALLIINPVSGTRSKSGLADKVKKILEPSGIQVIEKITGASGDAAAWASEAASSGVQIVISAGGDGTVNEIAGAISHTDTILGIIPLGSGNGLARTLGIPQDVNRSLKIIKEGHAIISDRGMVNGSPFYCTFGVGLDAAVSERFSIVKHRGKMTYLRSLIREFIKYKSQPYALKINGEIITEQALLIAVCNASQYGNNAYIAPKAKLNDGLLDVTVIHSGSPFSSMLMGIEMMAGNLDKNTQIETFTVDSLSISRLDEGPVHLDGEPKTMGKLLNIKCDRNALKVFAPEKTEPFKPIVSPLRALLNDMKYDFLALMRNEYSE